MAEIKSHCGLLDSDQPDLSRLRMGDLRKLGVVMDDYMHSTVAEAEKEAGENGAGTEVTQ